MPGRNTGFQTMFADHTSISSSGDSLLEIENTINNELHNVNIWLETSKQTLNTEKTESMLTPPLKSNMTCDDPTMGECDSILHCVTKLKGLKIASLNVNSLLKHIDEIRHLLFKFPFDIFAINESKIDDSITDGEISISGFNLIRKDRSRAESGVVLYIRESLSYIDRNDLVPDRLEMLCAEINRPFSKSLFVCTCMV